MSTTQNVPAESSLRGLLSRFLAKPASQPVSGTVVQVEQVEQVEPSPNWWRSAVVLFCACTMRRSSI